VLLFYLAWPAKRRSLSRRERQKVMTPDILLNGNGEATVRETSQLSRGEKEGLLRPM
jgi:hypothetical protein